jgi:DnaK suppressor protein
VRDLEQARADALERISALAAQHDEIISASVGSNADDEHDPEGATIAFERQQVLALLELAQASLVEIQQASDRDDRCQDCGQPIGEERLTARPSALRCITCANGQARRR